MIIANYDELRKQGFYPSSGPLSGALMESDYYMTIERKDKVKSFLILRKIEENAYIPHRARDISGKDYTEKDLEDFQSLEKQPINYLISILNEL